ncbi:MAG: hypothetical protein HFH93_04760 [Lachnospiraceae bacterium]|nr:hypothetical protein [Lachnospiraceae bacterium]
MGYELVIYDNWCKGLQKETNQELVDIDRNAFRTAISKYEEILSISEKCMHKRLPRTPVNAEEAGIKRQTYIGILERSRQLEEEAIRAIGSAVGESSELAGLEAGGRMHRAERADDRFKTVFWKD